MAVYVPISAVFPGVAPDFETLRSLLMGLSRTETLVWCARLNVSLSNRETDHIAGQSFFIKNFLSRNEIDRVVAFTEREQSPTTQVIVFSRGQVLELIRWVALYCQDLPGDGKTFDDLEVRRGFSQAALICSDQLDKTIWGQSPPMDTVSLLSRGDAPGLSRKSVEATATIDPVECLGRGWTLFRDYLPNRRSSFNHEFELATGLSIEQYFACLAIVLSGSMREARNAGYSYKTVLQNTPGNELFQKYMALESQTPEELKSALECGFPTGIKSFDESPPFSKRPLRDKPILRTNTGLAIIIDPLFFGDSAIAGPLFHVLGTGTAKAQDLFSSFGLAFEDYANDILGRMFRTSPLLANRLLTNQRIIECGGKTLEVDACIDDVQKLALIESKALWVKEEPLLSNDPRAYFDHLSKKYVEKEGIQQLADRVSALANDR